MRHNAKIHMDTYKQKEAHILQPICAVVRF